jgi:hypothetical protein
MPCARKEKDSRFPKAKTLYQFQIKDDLKAARIEATRRNVEYVELSKTSQRREGLDMELRRKCPELFSRSYCLRRHQGTRKRRAL